MKRSTLLIVFVLVTSVLSGDKTGSKINSGKIIGDLVRMNINRIDMPLVNDGSIGDFSSYSVTWYPTGQNIMHVLYDGGFGLTGLVNGELRASFIAKTYLIREWQAGKWGMDPTDPLARFYGVSSTDTLGSLAYIRWADAVSLGADFIDLDHNGYYNPYIDRPLVMGDRIFWTVFNDGTSLAQRTPRLGTRPMGLEVFQTVWAYESEGSLNNTIFFWFRIINASDTTIQDAYFTITQDPDIGDADDDLVGMDTSLSLAYSYNGDDDQIYGNNPPAMGVRLLQGPLADSPGDTAIVFNGLFSGLDTLVNARVLPWRSFLSTFSANPLIPEIYFAQQVRYYQIGGLDRYGNPIIPTQWGTGASASTNPNFFYSGDPVTGTGWRDITPSDKRSLASTGPFQLAPADTQDIIFAYVVGQGNDPLSSITRMREYTNFIGQFFPLGRLLRISVSDSLISVDSTYRFQTHLYRLAEPDSITAMTWQVLSYPSGSTAQIIPGPDNTAALTPDLPGEYRIVGEALLSGGSSLRDTLMVSATSNNPPAAQLAIQPHALIFGENATANASGSSDPDGDPVYYQWDFPAWVNVTTADTSVLDFTPRHIGKDEVGVMVSDSVFTDLARDTFLVRPLQHGFYLLDSLMIPSKITDIQYREERIYLATASGELYILGAGQPMQILASYPVNGDHFIVQGDTLIIYKEQVGGEIYLIHPHQQLVYQSSFSADISDRIHLRFPYLLVPVNNSRELAVYDISDLTAPAPVYDYQISAALAQVSDITFSGSLGVFYTYPGVGLVSLDISDPLQIARLDTVVLPLKNWILAFNRNQILALNGREGGNEIKIFAAGNPANLQELGSINLSSDILGYTSQPVLNMLGDGIRLILETVDGVKVFDISDPALGEEKIYYHTGYRCPVSAVNGSELYAGWLSGVDSLSWLYRLEMDTTLVEIAEEPGAVIEEVRLFQNYPNPFNAGTTICYQVQEKSMVKLVVYNLLGQQVRWLVREEQPAGEYSVWWDGVNAFGQSVSSGIYIYRISADNYVQSRKMMLLK